MAGERHGLLCGTCRAVKPWREFKWAYGDRHYCSPECTAAAMSRELPTPRTPHE